MKRDLHKELGHGSPVPFIGIYDVFSASIAARHYDHLFLSGFGFAASHYGLPDIGFISWSDMVAFAQRVAIAVPQCHLLVDIDDGYVDPETACHVVSLLESIGVSGVILEDQQRPRRCGHFEGKRILPLDEYLLKLQQVLATRRGMLVVARTDAREPEEIRRRALAFAEAGADVILVDAIDDLGFFKELRESIDKPMAFNQIAGGLSPACTLQQLHQAGASMVIYSTPCLFAAQVAMEAALQRLSERDGLLPTEYPPHGISQCTVVLNNNLHRRVDFSNPLKPEIE